MQILLLAMWVTSRVRVATLTNLRHTPRLVVPTMTWFGTKFNCVVPYVWPCLLKIRNTEPVEAPAWEPAFDTALQTEDLDQAWALLSSCMVEGLCRPGPCRKSHETAGPVAYQERQRKRQPTPFFGEGPKAGAYASLRPLGALVRRSIQRVTDGRKEASYALLAASGHDQHFALRSQTGRPVCCT